LTKKCWSYNRKHKWVFFSEHSVYGDRIMILLIMSMALI